MAERSIFDAFAMFCKSTWIESMVAPGHKRSQLKELDQTASMRSARDRMGGLADCWAELQLVGRDSIFEFKGRVGGHSAGKMQTFPGADLMLFEVAEGNVNAGSGGIDGWLDNILRHREEGWLLFDVSFVPCKERNEQRLERASHSRTALIAWANENSDGIKKMPDLKVAAEQYFGKTISRRLWQDVMSGVKKRSRGQHDRALRSKA